MNIRITLDNSCFDEKSLDLLLDLAKLKKDGKMELTISHLTHSELSQWRNRKDPVMKKIFNIGFKVWIPTSVIPSELDGKPDEENKFMDKIKGYYKKDIEEIFKKIVKIKFPQGWDGNEKNGLNNYIDIKLLAQHIARGGCIFITKDIKSFFKLTSKGVTNELIENEFQNTKLRLLNKSTLIELRKLINKN